jgi:AraC-like DNA-binding protein
MIGFTTLLIFFIFPNTSKELFSIKLKKKTTNKTKSIFDQILNYFEESEPFLNPNYNLSNLSIDTGFRNEIIRESIKSHSNKTVPAFINSHRIEKACKLIQEGYLKQYSMNALVEVSGFTSQPTFNRAFKLVSGKTPTEYSESYS